MANHADMSQGMDVTTRLLGEIRWRICYAIAYLRWQGLQILLGVMILVGLVLWDAYNPQSRRGLREIESTFAQLNFPAGVSLDQQSVDHKTTFGHASLFARYHSSVPKETIYAYLDTEFARLGWEEVLAEHPTYRKGPYRAQFYPVDRPWEGAYQLYLSWTRWGMGELKVGSSKEGVREKGDRL